MMRIPGRSRPNDQLSKKIISRASLVQGGARLYTLYIAQYAATDFA